MKSISIFISIYFFLCTDASSLIRAISAAAVTAHFSVALTEHANYEKFALQLRTGQRCCSVPLLGLVIVAAIIAAAALLLLLFAIYELSLASLMNAWLTTAAVGCTLLMMMLLLLLHDAGYMLGLLLLLLAGTRLLTSYQLENYTSFVVHF